MFYQRILESTLLDYIHHFPAVGLTGPRQSGKSTLLQLLLKDYQYVSFDQADVRAQFYNDPMMFMKMYPTKVIFDEVQKVPEIFEYVKNIIDENRSQYGQFILTGSNQFNLMENITESLAGRIGLLNLLPLQFAEIPETQRELSIFKGGFPELVVRNYDFDRQWFASYLATYLERDARQVRDIGNLNDFQRLITLLAANTSQILDMTHYAKDIGVAVNTIKKWISVLAISYIIFLVPPFHDSFGKRISKRPKLYFYDTGLVSFLTGISNSELYHNGPMAGAIFENYVISEILKKERHVDSDVALYYLRTGDKDEIDLIIDRKISRELIEIKKSQTYKPQMIATLKKFLRPNDKGILLYCGKTLPPIDNIAIKNYQDYLQTE